MIARTDGRTWSPRVVSSHCGVGVAMPPAAVANPARPAAPARAPGPVKGAKPLVPLGANKKALPPAKKKSGGGCCGFKPKKNAAPPKPGEKPKEKSFTSLSSLFKRKQPKPPAGGAPLKNVNGLPKPGATVPLAKQPPGGVRRPVVKQMGQKPPMLGDNQGLQRGQQLGIKRDKSLRKLKQGQPIGTPTVSKSPAALSSTPNRPKQPNSMTRPKALSPPLNDSKKLSPPAPKDGLLPISPAILATESPAVLPDEMPKKFSAETSKSRRHKPRTLSHMRALEASRVFQEVKLCVATRDNGMTERRVLLTSVYPTGNPPKIPASTYPRRRRSATYTSSSTNTSATGIGAINSGARGNGYGTLDGANSVARVPSDAPCDMDPLLLSSPLRTRSPTQGIAATGKGTKGPQPPQTSRERAMNTILQLRGHYQLTHSEIRLLSRNPDLKLTTIRAGIALQEAQRNLRNLKILTGTHLLPDLSYFADELSAVILELDRFIDAIHTVSEHADTSPTSSRRPTS